MRLLRKEYKMSLTYQEIISQYDALKKTYELFRKHAEELKTFVNSENFSLIAYVGCGSSYSIASGMAVTTQTKLAKPSLSIAGGDLMLHHDRYKKILDGALIVAVSRSGSTSEVLKSINALKNDGCRFKLLTFSAVENSKLSQISDFVFDMPWAFDQSVCQTRTVTNFYLCGALFAAILDDDQGLLSELKAVIDNGENYLHLFEPVFKEVAGRKWGHGVVLGDAELCGICEEGALTFKEICQVDSNYYHLLDARHGPMVMIKSDTLVIAVVDDPKNTYERGMIEDIVKKQAVVVVYSDIPCDLEGIINICYGKSLNPISRGIPFILIPQLINYYKSAFTGADPDKPEGLDPWIKL